MTRTTRPDDEIADVRRGTGTTELLGLRIDYGDDGLIRHVAQEIQNQAPSANL